MRKLTKLTLPIYAFSAFGPGVLGIFITAYLLEALLPAGLDINREFWSIAGYSLVSVTIFSIFFAIIKSCFSIFELKISTFLQNINSRYGKYRFIMLISTPPMILTYIFIWLPPSEREGSLLNTIFVLALIVVHYTFSSLWHLSYYSTFTEVVENERGRVKLSSMKAVFDTIGYSIAYGLLPVFIGFGINIQKIVLMSLPLTLTMLIPLFVLKEEGDSAAKSPVEKVTIIENLKHTLKYRDFVWYILVVGVMWFGLEMFLSAQNGIASGVLKLNGWQTGLMNTSVFAPVPLAVMIFNKIQKKRGIRPAFQLALACFAVSMLFYAVTGFFFAGAEWYVRVAIIAVGGLFGSYSIAVFFATLYIIPTQIAANDMKLTGVNATPMFLTVQTLVRAFTGALSGILIYTNLKEISIGGNDSFGISLIAPIVALSSIAALILTFRMPRNYEK